MYGQVPHQRVHGQRLHIYYSSIQFDDSNCLRAIIIGTKSIPVISFHNILRCTVVGVIVWGLWLGLKFFPEIRKFSVIPNVKLPFISQNHSSMSQGQPFAPNAEGADKNNSSVENDFGYRLNEINPLNDWFVCLDVKKINDLLRDPHLVGVRIVDHLPELGIVRFSVIDSKKAFPLLADFIENDLLTNNQPLRQPLPPRDDKVTESMSFSNSFISWLGGSSDRDKLGRGVKIALLDSGIDSSHPALKGMAIIEKDFLQMHSSNEPLFKNGHGTALASVIAAQTESYVGIAPGSEILSYRVIDETGKTDSFAVASAILSAVEDGADVINLSLGGHDGSELLRQAVNYAFDNGVTVVAAVGNDGLGLVNYPATYDGVIGVTSVGASGRVSSFSNYGEGVDLAAPGVGVLVAGDSSTMMKMSGTSVSTAMVSGAVAMILAQQPNLTPSEIELLLQKFANESEKPGFDLYSGHGVLSLGRLENQNNPQYSDPAITGYYFEHSMGADVGTMPFEVMVQNQGNTWLGNLSLQVNYLGMEKTVRINNLAPGELRAEKLYIQRSDFDEFLQISSQIHLPNEVIDSNEQNNKRSSIISF